MFDHEQAIKDIYKIAGMLEMLTCMQDHPLTSGMVAELADAVDKLELIGAEMMNAEDEITIDCHFPSPMADIIDFFDDDMPGTDVNAHEGSEESAPEPLPSDQ